MTRPVISLLLIGLLLAGAGGALLAQESPLHPTFLLLDAAGTSVLISGQPVSTLQTCGGCHDTDFITSHTRHGDGGRTTAGVLPPQTLPVTGVEMNCFLCHITAPNNAARLEALESGQADWASTATLLDSGIVTTAGGAYRYNPEAFDSEGRLLAPYVTIQDPRSDHCGACHGLVHMDNQTLLTLSVCEPKDWRTYTTGQVVSPQRISSGAANIASRSTLTRAWDVHAERVLNCVDCHFSTNNPIYALNDSAKQPAHLIFDPRRIDIGEYLKRPAHEFASGSTTMRACETCHDPAVSHRWLPYLDRHLNAVACESCHIPQMHAPALAYRDATIVQADGRPVDGCRGIENGITALPADLTTQLIRSDAAHRLLITGYQPVLLQQRDADGTQKLSPYNLVTLWYWVYGETAQPVPPDDVQAVYLTTSGTYAPDVLDSFDSDGDGQLSEAELVLDSAAKTALIAGRLAARGFDNPRIVSEVQPYPIHHNVIGGTWAIRDCQTCHSDDSRVVAALALGRRAPGGIAPTLVADPRVVWNGAIMQGDDGMFSFQPETQTAAATLYLFGRDRSPLVDTLGALIVLLVSTGVTLHAGLRVLAGRKQAARAPVSTRREYMYSIYERQWHWLQTAVIFGLVFTGLVIHRPQQFSLFSFAWMVDLHNIFALLLVLNAALALFYHLVSGQIRQFIPRPYGFFDQMVQQALYYLRGIFRAEPHPFEKTPDRKLNPLQQVTYLLLLNVLLPGQIITGALMWGAQRLPELTAQLGGLPLLAPLHTLIAWLFMAFIILHVYLTTTGPTPLANIRAMIGGYEQVETHPLPPAAVEVQPDSQ